MKKTLTRKEIVHLYNALKRLNTSKADHDAQKAIIYTTFGIQSKAKTIIDEDNEIRQKYLTEDWRTLYDDFKAKRSNYENDKNEENLAAVNESWEKFTPLDTDVANNIKKEFDLLNDMPFEVEVKEMTMDNLLSAIQGLDLYIDGRDTTIELVEPLKPIIKDED